MSSLRVCVTPWRQLSLRLARPSPLRSNATAIWSPSTQHTTIRTLLLLSRKEKELHAIQETSGLLSEEEKQILALKEAKRAKFAERMQKEHGENWEAIVEEKDRAEAAARAMRQKSPPKKKSRWTQAQKDEAAAQRAEKREAKRAAREAKEARKA